MESVLPMSSLSQYLLSAIIAWKWQGHGQDDCQSYRIEEQMNSCIFKVTEIIEAISIKQQEFKHSPFFFFLVGNCSGVLCF